MDTLDTHDDQTIESMVPEFDSAESIREYYGLREDITLTTEEEETELLDRMRERHPDLNGQLDQAHDYVSNLYRQHLARNEVRDAVRGEISEPQMKKHKNFFRRHKFLTAAVGVAALIALLYFTTPLATTAGAYGAGLIESFKTVLANIGVDIPAVATEATAAVPVTGEAISSEVAQAAAEAFSSTGEAFMQNANAAQAIEAATGAAEVTAEGLSAAAGEVLGSPEAAKALEGVVGPSIEAPLQNILRNLPPTM